VASILVKVTVTSWFKRYTKGITEISIELETGAKMGEVLKGLGIPAGEVGSIMIEKKETPVEKTRVDEDYTLNQGDHVLLIPHILGG